MPDPQSLRRILIVTRNLPPLVGGMERLNWHMADELAKVAEVRVVGPRASAVPDNVPLVGVALRPLWRFLLQVQWRALREARHWRPDVVLAGSGLTAPAALLAARACGSRAAAYVHGLDLAADHPVYKALWRPALRRMDRVIANSTPTRTLAEAIGIAPARIGIVHPGVALPAEGPAEGPGSPGLSSQMRPTSTTSPAAFRQRHGLGTGALLLSVGRLSARKGLREFVTHALPPIVAARPDAMLVVVGDAPADALSAEAQTPASIRAAAEKAGVADSLHFLGVITDYEELGAAYRAADVHVFPVRTLPGDPEGFGMVAVEAAAHGLPTVAFATGGIVDAVAEGQSGYLVSPGNYAALAAAVCRTLNAESALDAGCKTFAARFAWPQFGEQLVAQLRLSDVVSPE